MTTAGWQIERKGRSWRSSEALERYFLTPEKMEMVDGRLFDSDHDRETMLCLLLENIGVDRAVHFGPPSVWRAAVADLSADENS